MRLRIWLRLELICESSLKLLVNALDVVAAAQLCVQFHDASIEVLRVAINRDRLEEAADGRFVVSFGRTGLCQTT